MDGTPDSDSPATPPRVGAWLAGILILAAVVRVLRWQAVAVMFNDGPLFLALAEAIADGNIEQALSHPFHPLYPAMVGPLHALGLGWETAAVAVSVLCGTAAVGVLFLIVRALHGSQSALIAATLLAVHPGAIEYTGDIQSEATYLLALLAAVLCLWYALSEQRVGLAFLGGLVSGLAYLARPEGIGAGLAVGALILFEAVRGRIPWRRALSLGMAIGVGTALVAIPYLIFLRVELGEWMLTQKKSVAVMGGLEAPPRDGPEPILPEIQRAGRPAERRVKRRLLPGREPTPEPTRPPAAERASEAAFDVVRTHLRSLRYEGFTFFLLGAFLLGLRPVGLRGRFVGSIVGLYAVVLFALAMNVGYVSGRHALPALTLAMGYVADGVLALASRVGRRTGSSGRRAALAVAILLFAGIGLGKALRPDRADSAAQRDAARWMAERDIEVRGLAARKRRIAYYAGVPHVKIDRWAHSAHRLWMNGASHVILSDDPDHYPMLQLTLPRDARLIHLVRDPEPGARVYELRVPPLFKNEAYRRRTLKPDDPLH